MTSAPQQTAWYLVNEGSGDGGGEAFTVAPPAMKLTALLNGSYNGDGIQALLVRLIEGGEQELNDGRAIGTGTADAASAAYTNARAAYQADPTTAHLTALDAARAGLGKIYLS